MLWRKSVHLYHYCIKISRAQNLQVCFGHGSMDFVISVYFWVGEPLGEQIIQSCVEMSTYNSDRIHDEYQYTQINTILGGKLMALRCIASRIFLVDTFLKESNIKIINIQLDVEVSPPTFRSCSYLQDSLLPGGQLNAISLHGSP